VLIALLIALGVDLIVVVALAVLVLGRRRWLKRQPGEFAGAIRVSSGDIDGLGPKWRRGSGRWVRDVLVWSKAPLMLRNELVPVDRLCSEREAQADESSGSATIPSSLSSRRTAPRSRSRQGPSTAH
jgi:hypothetical protein